MNWSDYEAVWRRQEPPIGVDADIAILKKTFETKHGKLAAALQVRDLAEASAGVIVSVAFVVIAWHQKKIAWPIYVAVALILGVTAFFVREHVRARRRKLAADAPLLAKVEADIDELGHQRRLILTLWRWYLGPCALATVLVGGTLALNRHSSEIVRAPIFLAGFGLFLAATWWFAWFINGQARRKQIEPRLAELQKLRRDLLASNENQP